MDDLEYSYENENYFATPDRNRNRLLHVQDLITSNNYTNDIKITTPFNPNSPQTSNNYGYDELGNLIKDESECIEEIVWTLSGKIAEIKYHLQQCSTKHNLQFRYDAMGNRVLKIEKTGPTQPEWIYTYYTRDAQGNVMAVYNISFNALSGNKYECITKLDERHIYGSSRIGLNKKTNENKHIFSATIGQNNLFDLITNIAVEYPNDPNQAKMFGGSGAIALYHDTAQSYTIELYTEHPVKIGSTAMAGFSILEGNGTWNTTDTFLTDAAQKIIIEALDTLYLFSTFEEMFGYMEYSSAKTTNMMGGSISIGAPLLPIFVKNYSKTAGEKAYEMVSHLGNVHMVISDRKVPVEMGSSGNVAYYQSDVISTNDMYPFGSLMPQRSFSSGEYRYAGAGGQESDAEVTGTFGNHYTAEYWMYDSRLARRWNVDPLTHRFSYISPFAVFENNPVIIVDRKGAGGEVTDIRKNSETGQTEAVISAVIYIFKQEDDNSIDLNDVKSTLEESLNRQFNEADGFIRVIDPETKREVSAKAIFDIKVNVINKSPKDIAKDRSITNNKKFRNNYFLVYNNGNPNAIDSDASGGNTGYLQINAPEQVWAHEFLHSLGWAPAKDKPGHHSEDPTSIMYHTISPNASVRAEDISNLNLFRGGAFREREKVGWKRTNKIFTEPKR